MARPKVVDASSMVPVRKAEWSTNEDGRVEIRRQKFGRIGTVLLKLARVRPNITLRLDALGSAAWLLMDGRTVRNMVDALEEAHPDEGRLDERIGLYLQRLVRSGVIAFDGSP